MALLTGTKILEEVENGNIVIDPFDVNRINPNSYNLRIADKLLVYRSPDYTEVNRERYRRIPRVDPTMPHYREIVLDSHAKNPTDEYSIGEEGFLLQPGILYLASTVERTYTDKYVPILNGRSSTGRLSMTVHITAGFGDIGFDGKWTLEIMVVHNLIIYPGDEMLQIAFETVEGDTSYQYNGRYNHQSDVTASRFYQDKRGVFIP